MDLGRGRSNEPASDNVPEALEFTDDPRLNTLLLEIDGASKMGESAVVVASGITENDRAAYIAKIKLQFPRARVLEHRAEGYSAAALEQERQNHPHDVIVVDAPVFPERLAALTPAVDRALRGEDARDAWRAWMEKAVVKAEGSERSEFAELKEGFDAMRDEMMALGHFSMALPNGATALACIAYFYASTHPDIEWDAKRIEEVLSKVSDSADATLYLHVDGSEMSVWHNGSKIEW